jgi:hypothetical protein
MKPAMTRRMNKPTQFAGMKHPGILLTLFCLLLPAITPLRGAEKTLPAGRGGAILTATVSLDGGGWLLGLDPKNVGCEQKWFEAPRAEVKPATVPCAMQELFPISSGLAWYWKEFTAPANPHAGGKYLLRFWSVDYKADVWVNGKPVGSHLDGEEPFTLDVTAMVRSGKNLLAVRVLNPVESPIDGFSRGNTVAGFKHDLPARGWNFGGILDSVELLVAPAIRIEDLHVITDWKSGEVKVRGTIRNAGANKTRVRLIFSVAPAVGGSRIDESVQEQEVPAGDTALNGSVRVAQHRLWEPDDPALYQVTARLEDPGAGSVDEQSARVGFRDFRFEDGFFRLNGRRIFLRCAHSVWTTPTMIHSTRDRETLRKDILYAKALGFNTLRYLPFAAPRCQLELADELGLMILQQSMSSWRMGWPADPQARPTGAELFDRSLFGVVRRDRNHPCIIAWYFLNEHGDDPQFRHAVEVLPKVRELDDTRVCLLNSGRWDSRNEIGSASNPGSRTWDVMNLSESHYYPAVPHHPNVINDLRGGGRGSSHFLSEYGIGSALDLVKLAREFEQRGADGLLEAQYNRRPTPFLPLSEPLFSPSCAPTPKSNFLAAMDDKTANKEKPHPAVERDHGALFVGSEGWARVSRWEWKMSSEALRQKARDPGPKRLPVSTDQIRNFVDCVLSREQPVGDLYSAIRSDILCHLIDISARTGRKLEWDNKAEKIVGDKQAEEMQHREMRNPWML